MQKTLKDSKTRPFAIGQRVLYQPTWARNRNNPRAYGREVYLSHYVDDCRRAVVQLGGLFYTVSLDELSVIPTDWPDTKESALLHLLQRNEDLKKEVNALAATCIFIAALILIVLLFRGI